MKCEMDLQKLLAEEKILIFDGAMGTELAKLGLETNGTVNLTNPDFIVEFHRAYAAAGVDALTTNTFAMNRINLASKGLNEDLREINLSAARLAKEAADGKQYVFGDIGPTGKLLEPYGTYSEEQFYENFQEQAKILLEGGVDGLLIETMTDLREAACALRAARVITDLPIIVTLSFAMVDRGGRTIMGNTVAEIVDVLEKIGADAVGANCGELSPVEMAEIAAIFKKHSSRPVLIQPNAGKPKLVGEKTIYNMTPGDFAEGVMKCIDCGATLVGGCCGTTLEHLKTVVSMARGKKCEQ